MALSTFYYSNGSSTTSADTIIGQSSYNRTLTLTSVDIGSGVTRISNFAFSSRTSLTSLTMPSTVTSIGPGAFADCTNLATATLSANITTIENLAFNNCISLISINIPNSVTSIGENVFFGCTSLISVIIGNGLTSIPYRTFYNCGFTSITIPNNVTSIGSDAFSSSKLTSINIPNSVTSIGAYAFANLAFLTSITIPNSVTSIGQNAFGGCYNLTRVNFLGNAPTSGGDIFFAANVNPNLKVYRYSTKSGWNSTFDSIPVLLLDPPIHKGLQTFGLADFSKGKISIKKQNQTKLEPYSIDGGSTVYDANNIYIFKGGSINTLGVIFDLTPANTIGSADIIYFNGNSYYKKTGGFIAAGWRDQNSIITDRSNTVIDPGTLIYFNPRSYKTTAVEVGAIIEKYNSPAKISLRSTCGYQNINKLIEISGNDAPIGLTFNNIAFDYSSFASSCSSLGLNPATILNSLGGVDFNYNYIVIRAKNGSTISNDSISNLGDGIINITSIGGTQFVNNRYYRFFVMCKTGWKIIRFYGTDYPI